MRCDASFAEHCKPGPAGVKCQAERAGVACRLPVSAMPDGAYPPAACMIQSAFWAGGFRPTRTDKDQTVNDVAEPAGEQILLVDDNPTNLQILYKTLQGSGYRLLVARDGDEALQLARQARPSLVLLDIMMPSMDGFEVCRRLKSEPLTADMAVIFLSALGDSAAKVKGFALGGVDYIAKPFQADEVVARVRTHIKIHRLERELARRNSELEAENQRILNTISEGIIGLDGDGRITTFNPAAAHIIGWPAHDALGEKLYSLGLFSAEQGLDVSEEQTLPYRSYALGEQVDSAMEMICRRDGHVLPVAMASTPRAGGGAVLVLRDISEWMDSEEALRLTREELESQRQHLAHMERLSTMGEMAAGIAHEVNQPLTAVTNYARVCCRMLQQESLDRKRLAEILGKLDTQAVRASEVIQRLRSYLRKPGGGRERVDLNRLIQDVIALAEVDSRINDVSIHFESGSDLKPLQADPVQLQQVALNLIRNAMEAMVDSPWRQQGIVVATHQRGDWVMLDVTDRGHGLSAEAEERLFQPFFTTKANGMGVGLSICQSIVHDHGGKITAHRNHPDGTTFRCTLPTVSDTGPTLGDTDAGQETLPG